MFKRKLFKRALPVILSIAMVFQSMPATTLAAEQPAQETTADIGTLSEESDNVSGDDEVGDSAAGDDISSGSASNENTQDENTPDESISDGNALGENPSHEADSGESASSEDSSGSTETTEETTAPAEETKQPAVDESEVQQESATGADGVNPNEDQSTNAASIVINESGLRAAVENAGLSYDEETGTIFAQYDADSRDLFAEILKGYYTNKNGKKIYFLTVELNGESNEDLRKQLIYTWKNADGSDLADGAVVPKNKGSYQLSIRLDKIENVCDETSETIAFRIDPCGVVVDYSAIDSIRPGTTAQAAEEAVREGYQLKRTDINGNETENFSKDAFVDSCTVSIIRETKEDGTKDGNKLNPDERIKSSEEYSVKLEITLTDKENYVLSNTSRKLDVMRGVETIIQVERVKADGTNFGWLYGEQPDMAELIKAINPYVVEAQSDAAQEKIVADAQLQYQWFDADGNALEETPGDGTKIPVKVKDAGTYGLTISYAGESGIYQESEAVIKIVISAADIFIGGIQTNTAEYVDGTKAANVIQTITGYEVYRTGDAEKKNIMAKDDKYFWGVSYNGDADTNTQSYEPVFKIRRGQHVTDKDGNDSVVWETRYLSDSAKLVRTQSTGGKDVTYEYRIEFSGKKAVYKAEDSTHAEIDINASQENYRVDVTDETLAANAFDIKLAVAGPVIDVTEMRTGTAASEENKGSLTNPIIKIYDAKPFFETKNDYKKAKVTGSNVPSTDLTYQWQKIYSYSETTNDDGSKDIAVEDAYEVKYHNVEYVSAPTEAGRYRIAVSYTDSKTGAVSKTEYVYYTIKKEDIVIRPESRVPAYYGETVSSYLADIRAALRTRTQNTQSDAKSENLIDYTVSDFTAGEDSRELANAAWLNDRLRYLEKNGENVSSGAFGALIWTVERKITEGDKAGTWYELQGSDTFVEGAEYRLTVRADWQNAGYTYLQNYNNRYELDFKDERIVDEQTGAYSIQGRYADQQSTAITPIQTEGITVSFEVDWDKILQTTKIYDGAPFDDAVLNAVKGAVKAYNTKTGEAVDPADISIGWYWNERSRILREQDAIHAGTYNLVLSVEKGEKYIGQTEILRTGTDKVFTIIPAELTVTPVLKDEIKAGTYISEENNTQNVKNIVKRVDVSGGIAENDKAYIVDRVRYYESSDISYPWIIGVDGPELKVTDKTTGQTKTGYLRGDRAYNVRFDFDEALQDVWVYNSETGSEEIQTYGSDYTLKFETVSFTAVRASSTVGGDALDEENAVVLFDSVTKAAESGNFTHTITPREGIPYSYGSYNKEGQDLGGNYLGVRITAPAEYADVQGAADRVIYQSSIENAGGYIYETGEIDEWENHRRYIVVAFDAARVAEDGGASFEITWEDGFTETFKLDVPKSLLMEDLSKAVLPKSLAFNSPAAKMSVGEGQQLDLKITKVQMADTICVGYESSDEKVLAVSDSGYVTAIHTGKATVTAYAAYQDGVDGTIKPFIDAKGNYAKAAKLNITVNKLSEVKKIKFEAHDTYAFIDYSYVPDGYRREVYVLAGANIAASEFETKINAVKNGNYDAFDAHLFIADTERNVTNHAGKAFWGRIDGLSPNTQYTVYVRNVSALRSFPNGEQIDASESATAGKPVKLVTTKAQNNGLNGYFKTAEGNQPVRGKTTVKTDAKSAAKYVYDSASDEAYYSVDISAKSVKFDVEAKYWQKEQADINYADEGDYIWYPLALTKDQQKDYVNPKLTYYVSDHSWTTDEPYNWKENGYVRVGAEDDDYYYFRPTTAKAAIDKNGKISLKGSGWVYAFAYDAEQNIISNAVELYITTAVDGLAGKAIKMKVGTTVLLSEYLTYKQKNIKLATYADRDLNVTWEDPDGAFEIIPQVYNGNEEIFDYWIKAKRPTSKPLELKVSDKTVKQNGGADITIKLSAAALDPVKGLKAYDVYDTEGMIRFDYADGMETGLKFRIEVKDQTGKILANELVDATRAWKSFVYKNAEYYNALYHHRYQSDDGWKGFREYDTKKKIWTYHYALTNLEGLSLTRLSSYTVSVTAVYGGYDAKIASAKIKTTNIPASKTNAVRYDDNGKDKYDDGGDRIVVYKDSRNANNSNKPLSEYMLLKSGSTYTLDFTGGDKNARNMKTDTLTWKSSNTKVATVKANPGTFTAAFKAVRKGTTQITVTSKITKKVIARWTVFVTAVGEADGYFGDNIYQDTSNADLADKLGADMLTLNKSMSFTLANGEKKWVAFRAPADGRYSVSASGGSYMAYDSDSRPLDRLGSSFNREMSKGMTYYFLVTVTDAKVGRKTVTITVSGTQYTQLTAGTDSIKVRGGSTVVFTAPEENVYTFAAFDKNGEPAEALNGNSTLSRLIMKNEKVSYVISGTGEYNVKVTPAGQLTDGTEIDIKQNETKYYKFTADETSEYTIYTADAAQKIDTGVLYTPSGSSLNYGESAVSKPSSDTDTDPKNVGFSTRKLKKGTVIYIALTAGGMDTTAKFRVEKAEKTGAAFTIAEAGGTKTVVYNADTAGEYDFTAAGADVTITSVEINGRYYGNASATYQAALEKGDYVKLTVSAKNADTSVTVTCTSVKPVSLKAGGSATVTVTNGLSRKIEFAASENGWYAFGFDKETVRAQYTKSAARAARANYVPGTEIYVRAGEMLTFTVTTAETTEQEVTVTASKNSSIKLTDMADAVTLTTGETYRYYWTAENEGLYDFAFTVTGASLTYSTEEGEDGSPVATLSGYYSKGDTFYLTVKTDDSAGGSFRAVIAKQDAQELKEGEDNAVSVDADASIWVSFTSKKTAKVRYQYGKTGADGMRFYESTGLDDDNTEEVSFTEDKVLRPGQKVYYKIENGNAEATTAHLTIQPVALTEIETESGNGIKSGTANIEAGANGWYHFHASDAGRYNLSVSSKAGEVTSDVDTFRVYESLTAETYSTDSTPFIQSGKDIYIRVTNNAEKADVTVTITNMESAAVPLETGEAKLQLKKDVTQYLVYYVTETGRYSLTAADADGKTYSLPVTYYVDNNDGIHTYIPVSAVKWTEGSKIVFAVTASEDIDVTVSIKQETLIELTDNAEVQTVSAGQTLYFRTKTTKDIRYFIETLEVADGLTLNYVSVSGWMNWNNGYTDFVSSAGAEEVVFGLTASSAFEGTKTFQIKRGIVSPEEIKAGTPAGSGELTAYHKAWYTFTPAKAGRYSIKAGGAVVYEYRNGITGSSSRIQTPREIIITESMLGKAVIYAIYHTDRTAAKKVSLSIAETTAEELVQGTAYTVDIAKVEQGENVWIYFRASEDGRYTFECSNAYVASSGMKWYKTLNTESCTMKYFGDEYCMNAGEAYYFPVSYDTKPEGNFTVSVSAVTDSSVETVSVSETAKTLEMNAGDEKWLKFTPEKTANYLFDLTNVYNGQMYQYDSIADESKKIIYNGNTYGYAAGKTVYFKLMADSSLPEGSKPSIKITSTDMQTLAEGENTIDQIPENTTVKYAFFAPSDPAVYSFTLTEKTDCTVYISRDGSSYNTLYQGGNTKLTLDKEHPAYIRMRAQGSDSSSAIAKITITKIASVSEINAGGSADVALTGDSNMAFYKFTAAEDGVYVFETDSKNSDVYVYITDSISDALLNPDNYYYYGNRKSDAVELDKGAVKYIRVIERKANLGSADDMFTLTCKKAEEVSLTGVNAMKKILKNGTPVFVRWTAGERGSYRFGFKVTDSSEVKYMYRPDSSSDFRAASSTISGADWSNYESSYDGERGLILEAVGQAQVEIYAETVPRRLYTGSQEVVYLDNSNRYEEFDFYAQLGESYVFYTSDANQPVNIAITDSNTGNTITPETVYWQADNCYAVYTFRNSQSCKLRVSPQYFDGSSTNCFVSAHTYVEYGSYGLTSGTEFTTDSVKVQYGGECWFCFTAKESDRYGFGASYSTYINLYRLNGNRLELLGTKKNSSDKIWSALEAGDTVLAQTFNSDTCSVSVTCTMPQQTSSWTINTSSTSAPSKSVVVSSGSEYVIPLTFSNLNNTAADYTFTLTSSSDFENIEMAMYKADTGSEMGVKDLVGTGYSIACKIDPNSTYELRVRNYNNGYWSGTIRAEKEYPYTYYPISLSDNAKSVTVKDGSEARFQFTVPEDGTYMFYGTADTSCDNYAQLWVDKKLQVSDDDGNGNSQFGITIQLTAGNEVELRTYMLNHAMTEGTYTVHVEKVPEDYADLEQLAIGGNSISGLAVGETVQYRIMVPSVSSDDSAPNGLDYVICSSLDNTNVSSDAVMDLGVQLQLASDASRDMSGNGWKKEDGNFCNLYDLIPGRPYILSVTNNGTESLRGSIGLYRCVEANNESTNIGAPTMERPGSVAVNIAENEEAWISYTAAEDGIFTFTADTSNSNGYIYLYREGSQTPTQSQYDYDDFSSSMTGKIGGISLSKGDTVWIRVCQQMHRGAIQCKIDVAWDIWSIESLEDGSNTASVTTDMRGVEGKVWMAFDAGIESGSYSISTQSTSIALQVYEDGQIIGTSSVDDAQRTVVTFEYKSGAQYQLGITTSQTSAQLTITKQEATPPDTGSEGTGSTE
ncbi:MAG: Ig-like domain-containing protein [Lachnospiraceae bacterium]|nr:Ig-like domain-containing protein [Lachnospiraceae bacterium]